MSPSVRPAVNADRRTRRPNLTSQCEFFGLVIKRSFVPHPDKSVKNQHNPFEKVKISGVKPEQQSLAILTAWTAQ